MYSNKVIQHFRFPKNMGPLKNPDAISEVGNPTCGDKMRVYLKVEKNKIVDIGFETMGCVAAISTSSAMTELAKGKTINQALKIKFDDIAKELGGLPRVKMHCSHLAVEALHRAVENYKTTHKK